MGGICGVVNFDGRPVVQEILLSPCLRQRQRSPSGIGAVPDVLQPAQTAQGA